MSSTAQSSASGGFMSGSSISGGLSISGLGWEGTDFTSMINDLRKIEMIPTNRMLKWKADWRDRQDAFRIVREQLVNLRDTCSKMSTMDKFMTKVAASTNKDRTTATAGSKAAEGSYRVETKQVATTSIWSLSHQYHDNTAKINATSTNQGFSYEYAGTVRTLSIPPNTTLESFKNMINNDSQNPGVRASIVKGASGATLQIKGMDQGAKNDLKILSTGTLEGFPPPSTSYDAHALSYKTNAENLTDTINSTAFTFTYSYKGTKTNVSIPKDTTLEDFVKLVNNAPVPPATSGPDTSRPSLPSGGMEAVTLSKNGTTGKYEVIFKGSDKGEAITLNTPKEMQDVMGKPTSIQQKSTVLSSSYSSLSDVINATGGPLTFTYGNNGAEKTLSVPDGMTLQQFIDSVNADLPAGMNAVTPTLKDGKYSLTFSGNNLGSGVNLDFGGLNLGTESTAYADPPGWNVQHSQNALLKVDGFPANEWLEVSSNTVKDVVEGLTFNLIGTGEAVISVNVDAEAIQENVVQFIEAVNSFRKTVYELTKYDSNKETYDVQYAESLYEMQKGSILTGNYGVQLLNSQMKQATVGMAKGFMPRTQVGDMFFGDLYTSLSQLGIKTNATGDGGDSFGLLELNDDPKLPILSDVLRDNPEAVAEFFAAVNKGVSDSSHFSFADSTQNITRPGSYQVEYAIGSDGKVVNGTAFINGKPAKYYEETGQLGVLRQGPQSTNSSVATVTSDGTADVNVDVTCTQIAKNSSSTVELGGITDTKVPFIGTGTPAKFTYKVDGVEYSVDVNAGETLEELVGKINYGAGNPGVIAAITKEDGDPNYKLVIENKTPGAAGKKVDIPWPPSCGLASGITTVAQTSVTGQDAQYSYKVNGGTAITGTSSTNTITNIIPGVSINLNGPGSASLTGNKHNDADGLYIQIDNTAPSKVISAGPPPVYEKYTGQVRIKQGKIPELLEMLNGTAAKPEEGMLGKKGAIQVLLDNYDKIIEGIDSKISRETDRITKWERTTKLRFSRLEATLSQYDSLNKMIESQVKQLGSSK